MLTKALLPLPDGAPLPRTRTHSLARSRTYPFTDLPTPLRTYSLTHHGCTYQVPLGAEARRGLERALLGAAARPTGSGAGNAAGTQAPPEPEAREYTLTLTLTLTLSLTVILTLTLSLALTYP